MTPSELQPPPPPPGSGDDDIIELTEVVEETPAEVVLDLRDTGGSLDFLRAPGPLETEPPGAAPSRPGEEDSLEDLLAALPDLPDDLELPGPTPVVPPPGKAAAPPPGPAPGLAQLSEGELRDLVREIIEVTVTRLAREMLPELAAAALERELTRLKARLWEDRGKVPE
uniref:Uncharacterized protein n=1 Tax=Desulfobacca acetoxidans TaxID=60893 RepID=A0A7V4LCC6_9BACT